MFHNVYFFNIQSKLWYFTFTTRITSEIDFYKTEINANLENGIQHGIWHLENGEFLSLTYAQRVTGYNLQTLPIEYIKLIVYVAQKDETQVIVNNLVFHF